MRPGALVAVKGKFSGYRGLVGVVRWIRGDRADVAFVRTDKTARRVIFPVSALRPARLETARPAVIKPAGSTSNG